MENPLCEFSFERGKRGSCRLLLKKSSYFTVAFGIIWEVLLLILFSIFTSTSLGRGVCVCMSVNEISVLTFYKCRMQSFNVWQIAS